MTEDHAPVWEDTGDPFELPAAGWGRIVIDTGVLWVPRALSILGQLADDIVLPAVAYAERARQYREVGRSLDRLDALLRRHRVIVEPMDAGHALAASEWTSDRGLWQKHGRDALIAGHIGLHDVLWTTNPRDFIALGFPEDKIEAIAAR